MTTTTSPAVNPFPAPETVDLRGQDWILINSSAGKDSQASLDVVVAQADAQGVSRDRLVVVHCDLGRVEWKGTRELAEEQARHYGLRFEVVAREQDLLDQIEARHDKLRAQGDTTTPAWPSKSARYCTSDQKRDQVYKLLTQLAREKASLGRPVRILNVLGLRAAESDGRADCPTCKRKQPAQATCTRCLGTGNHPTYERDTRASNGKREVTTWLPIHDWSIKQVWQRIQASGVRHHEAYDLGMERLSCCFCVFAGKQDLLIAGRHNPALLDAYCATEEKVGHTFTAKLSIRSIRLQLVAEAAQPAA